MNVVALTPPVVVALLVGLAFTYGKLSHNAQSKRLELADRTREIINRSDTSGTLRTILQHHLKSAFGSPVFLLFAMLATPVAALTFLTPRGYREATSREYQSADAQGAYDHITKLSMEIALANHPVMMVLLLSEMLVLAVPTFALGSLLYGEGHRVARLRKIVREVGLSLFNAPIPIGNRFAFD